MILEKMTGAEKLDQGLKVKQELSKRTRNWVGREEKRIKKIKTLPYDCMLEFNVKGYGQWIALIRINYIEPKKFYFVQWNATYIQKYFIHHAKEEINNGVGFYAVDSGKSVSVRDFSPHCVNRFRQRYYETEEIGKQKPFLDVVRDIIDETWMTEEERDDEREIEPGLYEMKSHSENGQFFGSCNAKYTFRWYSTFVSNRELHDDQLAYTYIINKGLQDQRDNGFYEEEDAKRLSYRMVKNIHRNGNGREELLERKKQIFEPKDPNEIDIKKVAKNAVNSILGICRPDFLRPNLISGLDPLKFLKGNK